MTPQSRPSEASGPPSRSRRPTSTANFGSSRREGHDASAFYDRFVAPVISSDAEITPATDVDVIHCADARSMSKVASDSVALVVTSPPYFAGKKYEEDLDAEGVPSTYIEYLELLRDVFAECVRVLEPGGRIAINVANLGRRPYRSLSGDVTDILGDLGLLLRGEVVWWKGRAAGGSCAWGTFQRPSNPVLRDVTERIVIASKGRFDRALSPTDRAASDLPSTATISREEFMEATTDLWEIAPESATRVGHPAPFPVDLPTRLIHLYTYEGDVVLDPFMGSGSTAVAAVRTNRHYVGFDTDDAYVAAAERRVSDEREALESVAEGETPRPRVVSPAPGPAERAGAIPQGAIPSGAPEQGTAVEVAVREGRKASEVAEALLTDCGFVDIRRDVKLRGLGIVLGLVATDAAGRDWGFDVAGAFTTSGAGLRRTDILWRSLAKAAVVHESDVGLPVVLLTTHAPLRGTAAFQALDAVTGADRAVTDVIEMLAPADRERLTRLAGG